MQTLGNRPDLFPRSYPHASTPKEPTYYESPGGAEKGRSLCRHDCRRRKSMWAIPMRGVGSPSTSFDCSGSISWVINHSGWNVGRQTAQGLYNICTPVSPEQAKPGDLVFFVGTYDTAGNVPCGAVCGKFGHVGTAVTPFPTRTSIQATGSRIFIVTGVCLKRQKGVNHYGNEQIGAH